MLFSSTAGMRTLPLVDSFRELLLRKQQEQARYRKLCGRSYCTKYLDYICVNELGERLKPNTLSNGFRRLLEENDMRVIRLHDLRHPYVKHTTKKYNSEKQKTQATKMDLIAWVFRFCTFNYSTISMRLSGNTYTFSISRSVSSEVNTSASAIE